MFLKFPFQFPKTVFSTEATRALSKLRSGETRFSTQTFPPPQLAVAFAVACS
jgi:hypothetical protein